MGMSISAGTIMAYMDLDMSSFNSAIDMAGEQLSGFASGGVAGADEVADLLMGIFAEIDVGRGVIAEIAHEEKTSSSVCYALISEMEKTNGREKGRRLWRTTILESVTATAS